MARFTYIVLSTAKVGRKDDFLKWNDEQHMGDVLRVDGVVSAKRLAIDHQENLGLTENPVWDCFAMYELDADDPMAVIAAIRACIGSAAMPMTDALDRVGLVQLIAHPVVSL